MTTEEARAIWGPLLQEGEGYLDAQARIENSRPLTGQEREAADVLFVGFIEAMQKMAEMFKRTNVSAG